MTTDDLPYMPVFPKDCLAEVAGMDAAERGVYWSLVQALWIAGGELPFDPRRLARTAGEDPSRFDERWEVCRDRFVVEGGTLSHRGVTAALARARAQRAARQHVAAEGVKARKRKRAARSTDRGTDGSTDGATDGKRSVEPPRDRRFNPPDPDPDPQLDPQPDRDLSDCAEPAPRASPPEPPLLVFPTVKGARGGATEWPLTRAIVEVLSEGFPDLDVMAECKKALAWTKTNRANRKTAEGMPRFLNGWMANAQNRGGVRRTANGRDVRVGHVRAEDVQLDPVGEVPL